MKRLILLCYFFIPFILLSQSFNLNLLGDYEWQNNDAGSDIWGWVDQNNNEYALVGLENGFSVVDVTNPSNPVFKFYISDLSSTWRDIKTWGNYAYVTTEADAGLLIVDLTDMTGNTYWHVTNFTHPNGNSVEFTAAHNIYIDENGIAYIFGASSNNGSNPSDGVIFLDVNADPISPHYLGEWDEEYIHDGMVRGDTLYAGCINVGELFIIDVSDKSNPQTLGRRVTPSNFTHNAWISDNGDYVFTTDERSDAYIGAYDITNMSNIQEVDRIQSNPGSLSIPHNTHVDGNFIITSWYRDGTTVHDVTYPNNMIQVAYYDSYSGTGDGFDGCWGTYPFLPSGNIISSDINSSSNNDARLLVFRRDFQQACYLEGDVTDLSNGNPIVGATIEILNTSINNSTTSDLSGHYMSGTANAATYDILFSKPGYLSDTISASLTNGVITYVNASLQPLVAFNTSGMVIETAGLAIPNADVLIYNNDFSFSTITDNNGNFSISGIYEGNYEVVVGSWGYLTYCNNEYIDPNSSISISLDEGYYDDFTFDFGWTVSGGVTQSSDGKWERGDPEGTSDYGVLYNPENDISNDCANYAFVTGLSAGSQTGSNDVDDFNTILTSPIFNLSDNQIYFLSFYSWFANGFPWGNSANDSLKISISNGNTQVLLETQTSASNLMGQWNFSTYQLDQYINLTSNMQLILETADWDALGGHWVEAGFDLFQITVNPPNNILINKNKNNRKLLKIIDILGREVVSENNTQLFYIYDDGSVDNKFIVK